ncbi:MAG: hypothetical protein WCT24_02225 [Patescibacteria group bacterium]
MKPQETQRVVIRKTRPTYSKEHKVGFIFISCFGGLAFILGAFYLIDHLGSPFDIAYIGPEFKTTSQKQAEEIAEQKTLDTDGDGLTDFNELYVHKTSPYLRDTDGDGYTDDTELKIGTDPNCKGTECMNADTVDPSGTIDLGLTETADSSALITATTTSTMTEAESLEALKNLSVEDVRDLLVTAGIDEQSVEALTDDEVMALYASVLAELNSTSSDTSE